MQYEPSGVAHGSAGSIARRTLGMACGICIALICGQADAQSWRYNGYFLPGEALVRRRLAGEWLELESKSFRRLVRDLGRDEFRERQRRDHLENQIEGAIRWSQGGSSSTDRLAARQVMLSVQQSPELREIMQTAVQDLPASHFVAKERSTEILGPDGALPALPPALTVHVDDHSSWAESFRRFASTWTEVAAELRQQVQPAHDELTLLRNRFRDVRHHGEAILVKAAPMQRACGRTYLLSVEKLVLMAEMPVHQSPIARTETTPDFAGGTVADLLQYLDRNEMSLRYGSAAQLAVASVFNELVAPLEYQLAQTESRIEHYKAQNPAHNSVLRSRLLGPGYFDNYHHGLNSPAYGGTLPPTHATAVRPADGVVEAGRMDGMRVSMLPGKN
ncbi:hypothetical protein Pan44_50710 [Caulifigura coniformis]|uniref:Uncharacterized protein n=1 Tax=Caulifigura coniformis TaxID=2527983 RepID=A0A517SLL0_9PLAN|nr:hypothetical protein [Caulifigura coniformis]QDT57006.1 hypothetical protein Pan44_50710 [Caulifigura coniformis]